MCMPTRTRLLLAKDLDPVPRCEFLTAGSGAASGCLLLANTDHHTNLFVLDCATLKLRQVPGLSDMETPFPRAHGMACGTVTGEDRLFLAEGRYDHVKWGKLKGTSHATFVVERGGSFGDEGSAEMTEPHKICLSRGELWIVRGGDNHEPFITVVQAATGTKTGHIPASDLGAPVSGPPGLHVRGLALSNEEAFVVTGTEAKVAAKVFSREERTDLVAVTSVQSYMGEEDPTEVGKGYAFQREIELPTSCMHLAWHNGLLFVCCRESSDLQVINAVDGKLMHSILLETGFPISTAVVVPTNEDKDEVVVLDSVGNLHFFHI